MSRKKCNIFIMLLLVFTILISFSCVFATSASTEKLEARLSLWMSDGKTQIRNKSTTELKTGDKLIVGYNPKENFTTVEYKLIPSETNIIHVTEKLAEDQTFHVEPKSQIVSVKDEEGKYQSISIMMPDYGGEYKLEMSAVLADGTRTETKEYTFKVTKNTEPLEARLSLWMSNGKTQIRNKSTTELKTGDKVIVGYNPKENFTTVEYKLIPSETNIIHVTEKLAEDQTFHVEPKSQIVSVKDKEGKYQSIAITMPDYGGEYKLEMSAVLADGTRTETKEYTFKVTKSTEPLEARLSLWMSDGKTQIRNKSTTELKTGDKVIVGYNPKENFTTIEYKLIPSETNIIHVTEKLAENQTFHVEPKSQIVFVKDKEGKYQSIAITMPDYGGEYKLEMSAVLADGTRTETKEYTFKVTKSVDQIEARLSLWKDTDTLIKENSTVNINFADKVYVGYNPKENFKAIEYQFIAIADEFGNIPKVKYEPVKVDVKDKDGKYQKVAIEFPDNVSRVKLQVKGILINGNEDMMKEYIFVLKEGYEFIKANDWKGSSTWANEELANAKNNDLIPENILEKIPTEGVTRKEFVAIVVKLYEAITEKEINVEFENPFVDTSDEYVLKAYKLGVTTGVSETEFAPNKLITREQMATMMARAIEKTGIKIDTKINESFADSNEISDWAKESVYFMNEKEILKGMENNLFKAKNTATREQAVVIAQRCLKNLYSFE